MTDRQTNRIAIYIRICDLFAVAGGYTFKGVTRGCDTYGKDECKDLNDEPVPSAPSTKGTGRVCYCMGDLCNSAPQTSVGRMALIFTAVSLLALAAGRSLSQ